MLLKWCYPPPRPSFINRSSNYQSFKRFHFLSHSAYGMTRSCSHWFHQFASLHPSTWSEVTCFRPLVVSESMGQSSPVGSPFNPRPGTSASTLTSICPYIACPVDLPQNFLKHHQLRHFWTGSAELREQTEDYYNIRTTFQHSPSTNPPWIERLTTLAYWDLGSLDIHLREFCKWLCFIFLCAVMQLGDGLYPVFPRQLL